MTPSIWQLPLLQRSTIKTATTLLKRYQRPAPRPLPLHKSFDLGPSLVIVLVVLCLLLPLLALISYPSLQQVLLGSSNGYRFALGGQYLLALLWAVLSPLLILLLTMLLYALSPSLRRYNLALRLCHALQVSQGLVKKTGKNEQLQQLHTIAAHYDLERMYGDGWRQLTRLLLAGLLLTLPLHYLALHSFIDIDQHGLHHCSVLQLHSSHTPWSQVDEIRLQVGKQGGGGEQHLSPQFLLRLHSGQQYNLWQVGLFHNSSPATLIKVLELAHQQQVTISKAPLPSLTTLNDKTEAQIKEIFQQAARLQADSLLSDKLKKMLKLD